MTVSLKHKFTSTLADDPDPTIVHPSNWNDQHSLTGAANQLLGFDASGNAIEVNPASVGSGATPPAGSVNQIQYNAGGTPAVFGGIGPGTATTVLHGGTPGTFSAVNLATDVTGTLPAANGGFVDAPSNATSYGRVSAAWARVVNLAGDTMTGGLTVAPSASAPFVQLTAPSAQPAQMTLAKGSSGQYSGIYGDMGASPRWLMQLGDAAAESGGASGSTGSDFSIQRYNNSGTFIDTPLFIARATGIVAFAQAPTIQGGAVRVPLSAATTFFVSTTGSDTTGTGASGSPWQTLQHAYNVLESSYDFAGHPVTIQLADGTYTGGLNITNSWVGFATLTINGNATNPSNVIISTSGNCIWINQTSTQSTLTLRNLVLQSSSGGAIAVSIAGQISIDVGVTFGPCANGNHMQVTSPGAQIVVGANYSVSGGAQNHFYNASNGALITVAGALTATFTASVTFSTAFAQCQYGVLQVPSITWSLGSFTVSTPNVRYFVQLNGVIYIGGSGNVNYFPGTGTGLVQLGGLYN